MGKKLDVWDHNFATNRTIRERIRSELKPRLDNVREIRDTQEDEWERFFNMWSVKHDGFHTYKGRAQLYVPEVRKNVESQARQLTKAAMPSEDFFDVSPGAGGTKKGALIWKSIARWQIEQAQLRTKLHVFNRQSVMLGTSPVYIPWREEENRVFRSARDPKTGKIKAQRSMLKAYCGPDFITRDLFQWYAINPMKSSHKEDGCFEDYPQTYFEVLRKHKAGLIPKDVFEKLQEGVSEAMNEEELERKVRRMEEQGIEIRNQGYAGEARINADKDVPVSSRNFLCTRVYLPMVFPEACEEGEDPELPIPMWVEIYNKDQIALIKRNPFWHQSDPYLVGKYILPNADEFYGQGLPYAIQYMQYELNSKAEQTMDSSTLALNPIALIDPALAAQLNDFEIHPGAKWFVRPDGVKLASLPDLTPTGYQAMGSLRAQMQEYSDRTPALPPQLQGKSRTATQAEFVNQAFQVDLEAFQVQNEEMVLQPALKMWEYLTDQNIKDDQIVMILGRRASDWRRKLISKSSTLGSYEYFWKASSTLQNKPIKARQMIDLYKVINSLPPEVRAGLRFKDAEFIKLLWGEMLELPDGDKLFAFAEEMETQDPEVEHKMLELGMELEVLVGDGDQEHLTKHDEFLKKIKKSAPEQAAQLELHMLRHTKQLQAKKMAMARVMQMRQQQILAQAQRESASRGSGNRTQLSPNSNSGDMASGVRA